MGKKITSDLIADAIINMNENMKYCDSDTARGFKTSKKKDVVKSGKDNSFARFEQEILKRQNKKG